MSQPDDIAATELALVGATEGAKPLHKGGFGSIETDAIGARAITRGRPPRPRDDVRAWDLSNGERVTSDWLRLHPDGRRGLRAEGEEGVAVCDIASGEKLCSLEGLEWGLVPVPGTGDIAVSALRPDSADDDRAANVASTWDLATGQQGPTIEQAYLLSAFVGGERLMVVDPRGAPSVWDLRSGERIAKLKGPSERPSKLRVDVRGRIAVTLGKKGTTCVWDLEAMKLASSSEAMKHEHARDHFELLPDARRVLFASKLGAYGDHFIGVLDLGAGEIDLSWTTADHGREIPVLVPFSDSSHVALLIERTSSSPTTLEIWDVDRRQLVGVKDVNYGKVLALTSNHRAAVAGSTMSGPFFFRVFDATLRSGVALPAMRHATLTNR